MTRNEQRPIVMIFAGSDPTGGAGLVADIETLISLGCRPVPIVTAITAQDTVGIKQFMPVTTELVIAQARAVLEDMPVAAFKTGMLGTVANCTAIASIVQQYAQAPLVVDPVLSSGRGDALSEDPLEDVLRALLIPRATLVTPNTLEAKRLAPDADNLDACAQELLSLGAQHVLITGTHDGTLEVTNRLYGDRRLMESFPWPRLKAEYHGSGCTLATACAANLAHGLNIADAVMHAQRYTWKALNAGYRLGMGQLIPDRLYWARDDAER